MTGSGPAKASGVPPHITVSTPFSAPAWPPDTGASMNLKPRLVASASSSRAISEDAGVCSAHTAHDKTRALGGSLRRRRGLALELLGPSLSLGRRAIVDGHIVAAFGDEVS